MNNDYELKNSRIIKLKESAVKSVPGVCIERGRLVTEAYKKYTAESVYIKRARSLEMILENMSIYIKDGELLVGNQASGERRAPLYPEYAVEWMEDEIKEKGNFNHRDGDNFYLPEKDKTELFEIIEFWKGKTLRKKCYAQMPEEMKKASEVKVIHGEGNMTSGDGHIVPDFEKALKLGLKGIIREAEEALKNVDITLYGGYNKIDFLKAVIIVNKAVIKFARRYSDLADQLIKNERNPERKSELQRISLNCKNVPENSPENFWEAIQMSWFIQLAIIMESNGHSPSFGRMDQYLYPFYKKDIDNDKIDRDSAKELLQCLWVKLYSILKVRPTSHSGFGAGYPTYQNVTISGSNWDTSDSTNELSYLILESVAETKLTQPNLSARFHSNTPERFIRECAKVIALGFGMPAIHTDEIIIQSLLSKGVSYKDAYNYSMVGCVEVAVPGKWGYRCTGMSFINFVKTIELTLNDGYDKRTGYTLYSGNGKLEDFGSFEKLWEVWKRNISYYVKLLIGLDALADTHLEEFPDIFCSSLVDDCIKRGKSVKEGGAVYDIISGPLVGIANAANSLYALKEAVYNKKILSAEEISEALDCNFEGMEGERVKNILLNLPKYGNDNDDVDGMAIELLEDYSKEMSQYKNLRHGRGPEVASYSLSTSGISSNVPMGCVTGATPDGRKAYTPAAEGASPTQGTDTQGPTAVFNTIAKQPTLLMTGGQLLNQKFSPELIKTPEQFNKFICLIKSFIQKKCWHVQFNIIDTKTLRAAQTHPEEHRDVIVRIAGYCAQFITLDPTTQEDIIARTEQCL
ncbi:MAG TPA: glycyl radical protein [Victivallales bacterium]|nr:glycyl radical protein [Victivallales bacterium]